MGCRAAWVLLGLVVFCGQPAFASDSAQIGDRWSVVGVIAGEASAHHQPTGIAVLRSAVTQKSYTLTIGDPLPTEMGFILKQVLARSVLIANAETEVTLSFNEAPSSTEVTADSRDAQPSRTSRFLENYYRGFDTGGEEAVDDSAGDDLDLPAVVAPRLGISRIDRPGHIGYRTPRPTRADDDDEPSAASSGNAVFSDDDGPETLRLPQD